MAGPPPIPLVLKLKQPFGGVMECWDAAEFAKRYRRLPGHPLKSERRRWRQVLAIYNSRLVGCWAGL